MSDAKRALVVARWAWVALACAMWACGSTTSVVGGDGGGDAREAAVDVGAMDTAPACTADETLCGGRCANTRTDPANCGACGTACAPGQACTMGACQTVCPTGQTLCAGACVSTMTDRSHCGACGTACPSGQFCVTGACQTVCPMGQTACAGACVNTQTDRAHCGMCGSACPAGQACVMGACQTVCPTGQTACAGACVNTLTDRAHCGACDAACARGQVCSMGRCDLECVAPLTTCGGGAADAGAGDAGGGARFCADTRSDPANCGACGRACAPGLACIAGACGCTTGLTACTGRCVDTRVDPAHCGTCGNACPTGQSCDAGRCVTVCPAGFTLCGGRCVDTRTDTANCGACGTACAPGQACLGSACEGALSVIGCGPMNGGGGDAPADNLLSRFCTISGRVLTLSAGAGAGASGTFRVPVGTLPAGTRVVRAFVYAQTFDSASSFFRGWTFGGTNITARARVLSQFTSPANHQVVRAEVTAEVQAALPGSGGVVSIPFTHDPVPSSGGFALFVVLTHDSMPRRNVVIYDGGHTDYLAPTGAVLRMDGFTAAGSPPSAQLLFNSGGDGPADPPCTGSFTSARGTAVPLSDICEPNAGLYSGVFTVNVSSVLAAGDSSATLAMQLRNGSGIPFAILQITAP